jgi:S1-C subfamily serine protease
MIISKNKAEMKIVSYRTTMPFDNRGTNGMPSISPTTNKSVMPFNNVTTIQDVLDGNRTIKDTYPGTRGNWAPGEDVDKSYKEKGDEYKRRERDEDILSHMFDRGIKEVQEWRVKVPGGSKSFVSFELAQKYIREKAIPFRYLSRVAQGTKEEEANRVALIAESINKVFMVDSINTAKGVRETGSAFCVAPGYFLTCAHVVESYNKSTMEGATAFGQSAIIKLIQEGRSYPAQLVDFDLKLDLAMLRADINVEALQIGDDINIGEDVVVIGSPHGYENNVSIGVIGGTERKVYDYEEAPPYTFIDAAVFPGSSGGPVIKSDNGKVIGMITLIVSTEGEYGLNAALPSSYIKRFCSKYIS